MKIYLDNLYGHIETDNPKLLDKLVELYSIPDPQAFFRGRVFNGGKKNFISPKRGKFKAGLLTSILATLKSIECVPEIDNLAPEDNKPILDIVNVTPYDYQKELIGKVLSNPRCILQAPTGSGKTVIMACLVSMLRNRRIVLFFNQKTILTQTYEYFTKLQKGGFLEGKTIGICFGEGYIESADIMLCSIRSAEKLVGTPLEDPEVIIVDECHEFCSGDSNAIISCFANASWRIGFTATPPIEKFKLFSLLGALGPIIGTVNTQDLIKENKLAETEIIITPVNFKKPKEESYPQVYDDYVINNDFKNRLISIIVEIIKDKNKDARVLILVKNISHGRILQNLIPGSYYLQGSDNSSNRSKVINKFVSGKEATVLIGTKILQTGVNIPEITHFINARGLKSEIATIQALGRALRVTETVNKVFVYDFQENVRWLDKHARARIRSYKKEGHKVIIGPMMEEYEKPN